MADREGREIIEMIVLSGALLAAAHFGFGKLSDVAASNKDRTGSVTWIDDKSATRWPVRSVAQAWDRGSDVTFRFGKCPADTRVELTSRLRAVVNAFENVGA